MYQREVLRKKRQFRLRRKLNGSGDKPRLVVYRSNEHIYVQLINDETGKTLCSASSLDNDKKVDMKTKRGVEKSFEIGKIIAAQATEKGIKTVVFDRAGYRYHGRIKAVADGAREGGLQF
ncbi:50S ribosomal protein L18 [candidate division WWE3 bacterium]|nr:50S ribosomal protein L18 [candidate division WWE3 bacterium]